MSQLRIDTRHPLYARFAPAWQLMRDAFGGEDDIKARGETYLPMKPGTAVIADARRRETAYRFYRDLAEFPDLVALTVRGAVGTLLDKPAQISLPAGMEGLRDQATQDGLGLDLLHRRIASEIMLEGRYGLLPGVREDGTPYLAGYAAESIVNWDEEGGAACYVVLDESGPVRDKATGEWTTRPQLRECVVEDGRYGARTWTRDGDRWVPSEMVAATDRRKRPLGELPFVFINTSDLTPSPDDVPLYGLGRIAVRLYRMDANYQNTLYMTSEPTPYVVGDFDTERPAPATIGAASLWVIPPGGSAGMVEFTGAGLQAQRLALENSRRDAALFGAQLLNDGGRTAESGEAKRLRLGNQVSTLKTIAMTSAAGLEKALRNLAVWIGEDPAQVVVTPNLDFFEHSLGAQDITAIVAGWQAGAYSKQTMFERFRRGELIPAERSFEDEQALIAGA